MSKRYYKKFNKYSLRLLLRIAGIILILVGLGTTLYVFLPVILWQLFLAPVFSTEALAVPIPQATLVTPSNIKSLLATQAKVFSGIDYNHADNWFTTTPTTNSSKPPVTSYQLSIPKIGIDNAEVSTVDDDLGKHLVNFAGTCVPPAKGNCVVFGHSTLPQLFDPKNYHTIFANVHTLHIGDTIIVDSENIEYTYKIFSIIIVDPDDTSVLAQTTDDSYLTLITCTPPGTLWKRLIIKSRLEKI